MTVRAEAVDVTRMFGPVTAVQSASLAVTRGEVVGLLGANGAGKTTLIRMLIGLLRPTSGRVELLGGPPDRATRRRLGYMPQALGLWEDLTVDENLAFTAAAFGVERPGLPSDLVEVASTRVSDLPLGLRRRTAFAAALAHHPELLVLDEPTSGVGPLGRAELWETIHGAADDGAAVLVTTHHMDEAEQCDRLVVMSEGRQVASGTLEDIVAGHTVVEVKPTDTATTLARLDEAGLMAVPAGGRVRVPGSDADRVDAALAGTGARVESVPATFDEVFVLLSASGER